MSNMIVVQGRLQFPSLFDVDNYDKYSATILLEKGSKEEAKVKAAIDNIVRDMFGGTEPPTVCLKDGDSKEYDGYKGHSFVSASRKDPFKPHQLIDRSKTPVTSPSVFYAGCTVNMAINVWGQNNRWGKKVNAEIVALQFVSDGDRLNTGAVADINEDTFSELPPLDEEELDPDSFI